eukprot:gene32212-39777_t
MLYRQNANNGNKKATQSVVIEKGKAWFAGDNADWSVDSRDYGQASLGLIKGRAVCRVSLANKPHFEWFADTVSDKPFVNVTRAVDKKVDSSAVT